jgi:hypothetical protein
MNKSTMTMINKKSDKSQFYELLKCRNKSQMAMMINKTPEIR